MEIKMERRVKKIFLLRLEGYSHSDIGELLSIVECTSRAQYVRAKNILKKNVVL